MAKGNNDFVEEGSQNFGKGIVTLKPDHLLDDGECQRADNVDFSRSVGRLTKRRGYSVYVSAQTASTPVKGLHEFINTSGTSFLMAAVGNNIYNVSTPSTWTSIFAGALSGTTNFATFGNLVVAVNLTMTTQKWTGSGSTGNLLGTPPSNAKFVKSHRGRLFIANSSAGTSKVNFSALNNPEDWTTAGDAGNFLVGYDDGEQITGMASVGQNLIIFKQNSTWILKNGTPTTFQLTKISASIGCIAPDSIVECEQFALFLSNIGVYAATPNGVALMSYNIQPDFDSMSNATKQLACGGRIRTQYWLAVDTDSDSKNDTAYVLDYVYGMWGKYTNKKSSKMYTRQDGTLLSGGSDKDEIRQEDTTSNDNGSAITLTYISKSHEFGSWLKKKQLQDVILKTNAITGKTIVLSHVVDGVTQSNTKTFNLDAVNSADEVIHKFYHPPDTSGGLRVAIQLVNSETSADLQVLGYSLMAKVRERENG
jgi:hypothetical protein